MEVSKPIKCSNIGNVEYPTSAMKTFFIPWIYAYIGYWFISLNLILIDKNSVGEYVEGVSKVSRLAYSRFTTISSQIFAIYMNMFHKTEVQTVILRYFGYLYLNWIKAYHMILVKNIFFSCLKMHYFRSILPKWVLAPPKDSSSHIFKIAVFPKFFWAFT